MHPQWHMPHHSHSLRHHPIVISVIAISLCLAWSEVARSVLAFNFHQLRSGQTASSCGCSLYLTGLRRFSTRSRSLQMVRKECIDPNQATMRAAREECRQDDGTDFSACASSLHC
jgi:hypothetical protein